MNARALRKHLMRDRRETLFGDRAFLTVRIPLGVLPEPPPPLPQKPEGEGWKENSFGFGWNRTWEEEGRRYWEHHDFLKPFSGRDPREENPHLPDDLVERDGDTFQWWEGTIRTGVALPGEDLPRRDAWVLTKIDPDRVRVWKRYELWREGLHEPSGSPLLDLFQRAGDRARGYYPNLREDALYLTYGVKWRHRGGMLRFCSELSRALRRAREDGVRVKLIKRGS